MCLSSVHISPYACAYNFMYTHAIETIDVLSYIHIRIHTHISTVGNKLNVFVLVTGCVCALTDTISSPPPSAGTPSAVSAQTGSSSWQRLW